MTDLTTEWDSLDTMLAAHVVAADHSTRRPADPGYEAWMRDLMNEGLSPEEQAKLRQEFEASCGAEAPALVKQLDALEPAIGDVKRGGVIEVTYAPGAGTTVTGPRGTIVVEGKPLADALLRSWLGPRSADGDLKRKMLGK